ncbi:MAG: D-aminoacyl-tRNA deacylase [Traorella sp.]
MRVLIQRVSHASCKVDGEYTGKIEKGYLLFVGITHTDNEKIVEMMADKIINLRINEDDHGKMNLSIQDVSGEILSISQFTLYANCIKGRRPGFEMSANKDLAIHLYDEFNQQLRKKGMHVEEGIFGADMKIELLNDGPVTIMLDSEVIFNGK